MINCSHSGDTSSKHGNTSVLNFTISQTGNTTTALLNVSQGDLADGIGSNACTVIAMYTAVKFLQNGIAKPAVILSKVINGRKMDLTDALSAQMEYDQLLTFR